MYVYDLLPRRGRIFFTTFRPPPPIKLISWASFYKDRVSIKWLVHEVVPFTYIPAGDGD